VVVAHQCEREGPNDTAVTERRVQFDMDAQKKRQEKNKTKSDSVVGYG
jgi:hypothetical protein